ncbi:Predicted acetyltransferase [Saccharopolyspora antimicrobica]|uniref:Acetyltransferase n=1 Tax=Saccharopolyspora antimicrobica TaxID=455193 RepID=A0A1I5EFS5_9PSEU|nr:GNAT family N-acetyltransferase [Saccharopolyspora antimicrobica]RKT86800.1 putative acetyltransferase [Saccharopolyspora antimicrobica]SFO10334.1 Predicted acetyltransferase [Saccharopolyspora antimicrobica]
MIDVRALAESEFRAANDLFRRALLHRPSKDEDWERSSGRYELGRVLGAFDGGELVGTAIATTNELAVPGGRVAAGAVTGVGVRADRTRRGVLRGLMRAQLDDVAQRGEPVAMLHASEATIYERFGYGVASRHRKVELERARVAFRDDAPRGGQVRVLDWDAAGALLPEIYQGFGVHRPGWIGRDEAWWSGVRQYLGEGCLVAVHADEDGADDGFAVYEPKSGAGGATVDVHDLKGTDATAVAELWRFILGIDLVGRVVGHVRPLDEPLEWWLTDRRRCEVTEIDDDLWVRLVDVLAALRARTYGAAEPVVVEVRDAFLPGNEGGYRIGPDGVERSTAEPQLSLDVSALAALYLGDQLPSTLVAAGRVEVRDPASLAAADRLFATLETPWCGTGF